MTVSNDLLVRKFVATFQHKEAAQLERFFDPNVVFINYGDGEVHGRAAVLQLWAGVFANFEVVRFETVHQAVDGEIVLAEQIHHLSLPGGPVAPVMNLAVYELREGLITAWRDYTNPSYAAQLLRGHQTSAPA
jgi:limonene-1,2-epoxide hydrolase